MKTFTITQAKRQLARLLAGIQKGEALEITRRGERVAVFGLAGHRKHSAMMRREARLQLDAVRDSDKLDNWQDFAEVQ